MDERKITKRIRGRGPQGAEERGRLDEIREGAERVSSARPAAASAGQRRDRRPDPRAREARGLTWYAVAKRAGIPNPSTVRDIEYGRDTKLSSVQAVADALGLRLELVEA